MLCSWPETFLRPRWPLEAPGGARTEPKFGPQVRGPRAEGLEGPFPGAHRRTRTSSAHRMFSEEALQEAYMQHRVEDVDMILVATMRLATGP